MTHWILLVTTMNMLGGKPMPLPTWYEVPSKAACEANERRFPGKVFCVQLTDDEVSEVKPIRLVVGRPMGQRVSIY